MAQGLLERFDGEVPTALDDLVTLPGVGRKTGNVVRSVAFELPGLPVDTHVGRLSRRLGLSELEDPVKLELELNTFLPPIGMGSVQSADDPSRPSGVRREEAIVRRLHARRHLSVVVVAAAAPRRASHIVTKCSLSVAACAKSESVYSGPTNQVPATWFAGDAGIRRLALQSDGPVSTGPLPLFDHVSVCLSQSTSGRDAAAARRFVVPVRLRPRLLEDPRVRPGFPADRLRRAVADTALRVRR